LETRLWTAFLVDFGLDFDELEIAARPPLRPEADPEDLAALADIEDDVLEAAFEGFAELDPALDFGDAVDLPSFADDDEALLADRALEDAPPVADGRVAFFLVVAMSISVAESVDERRGWNR
jgi:hypothetical protein